MDRFCALAMTLGLASCAPGEFHSTAGEGELPGGGSGGQGGGGGEGAPAVDMAPAPGLTISQVALYQGVKRTLVGSPGPGPAVPIVAGRDALVRVFTIRDSSYSGRPVTGRLTISGQDPIYVEVAQVATEPGDGVLESTINFAVPGSLISTSSSFRVDLLQPAADVDDDNPSATYPPDGSLEPLGAQSVTKPLDIVIVPVLYNGREPDISVAQLELYRRGFADQYPVSEVNIAVRPQSITYGGQLTASGGGWSSLLNDIADLRQQDAAPSHAYYYGVFRPTDTIQQFCGGGCVAGLGFVPPAGDQFGRASIGLGFSGQSSVETSVHEVGHNHGRDHSPCGTAGDPAFPHAGGGIGEWGYSLSQGVLIDPAVGRDFMGYCDNNWVSDHTYGALFQRMRQVDAQALVAGPTTTWRRVLVHPDGRNEELAPITMAGVVGQSRTFSAIDSGGATVEVEGHMIELDHLDGGVVFYPERLGRLRSLRLVDDSASTLSR